MFGLIRAGFTFSLMTFTIISSLRVTLTISSCTSIQLNLAEPVQSVLALPHDSPPRFLLFVMPADTVNSSYENICFTEPLDFNARAVSLEHYPKSDTI